MTLPAQKPNPYSWKRVAVALGVLVIIGVVFFASRGQSGTAPEPRADTPDKPAAITTTRTPVTFTGEGVGNSVKAALEGDYVVTWQTLGDCYYSGSLDDDITENVFTADAALTGTNNLYGIPAGEHFVAVNTGPAPSCGWSVTFTPS